MGARILGGSIFLKILAVFAGALVLIAAYFWVGYLLSDWDEQLRSAQRSGVNYAEYVIADLGQPPDTAAARALSERLEVGLRIEGPGVAWATSDRFPAFDSVDLTAVSGAAGDRAGLNHDLGFSVDLTRGDFRYLMSIRGARLTLDSDSTSESMIDALFMIAVLLGVYLLIRRILRPIRTLSDGVERLRSGDLGVTMATRRGDELGRLIVSFNEMARAIRERVRARDQLLLDVSHELRSPLTRMKVALDMLPDSPAKESVLEDIEDTEGMIAGLLETERMDSRHGGLDRSRTDLSALLREVVESHAETPPGIEIHGASRPVVQEVDAERLRVLFGNLLSNAVKYSPEDGRPVVVRLEVDGPRVRVTVRDHGIGIDPDDLSHIFEPFFRADRSRSKDTGGYGLGLSLAKRIVEAHGGTIEAHSRPGFGTTIDVRIPGEVNVHPTASSPPPRTYSPGTRDVEPVGGPVERGRDGPDGT